MHLKVFHERKKIYFSPDFLWWLSLHYYLEISCFARQGNIARIFNIYLDLVERWQDNWAFHLFSSDFLFKLSWSSGSRTFCFLGSPVKGTFNSLHFIINLGRTIYDKISDSMHCWNSAWLSVLANRIFSIHGFNSGKNMKNNRLMICPLIDCTYI